MKCRDFQPTSKGERLRKIAILFLRLQTMYKLAPRPESDP